MAVKKACNLVKGDVIDLGGQAWVVSGTVAPDIYNKSRVDVPLRRNKIGGDGRTLGLSRHHETVLSAEPNRRAAL